MKKFLAVAGATMLTLSMAVTAMADVVSENKNYGDAGQVVENKTGWGSNLNGQFLLKDNSTVTFTFSSQSADTSNFVFGWVAEITDDTNYFTVTQGATGWFGGGTDWNNGQITHEKSWKDEENAAYAEASTDLDVTLTVTRSGKQGMFESKAVDANGKEYTTKSVCVWETAPEGDLKIQLGVDHGSMTLKEVKFAEAGEVEEVTTKERVTFKPSLNSDAGVANTDNEPAEEESSSSTMVIVVVVVVLVVAVVAGVLVATKKKK